MAQSSLTIPARSDQVRTARIVACAAARRLGLPDETVQEVRLAVGEAVARAVQLHTVSQVEQPVTMHMIDGQTSLVVEVIDRVAGAIEEDFGLAMAVIHGLVPNARLDEDPDGHTLHMSWTF